MREKKTVVVIGGGTGTATVLSALSNEVDLDLVAIVSVSDSGGSTGRLRDEFGFIPVGDIRQCLAALAAGKNARRVREMLLYRFEQDSSLKGHNLGNLILTALNDLHHSPGKAIEVASKILRINGKVYPISEQASDLLITFADGTQVVGEDYLNFKENGGKKITRLALSRATPIYYKAVAAIERAELIILGPGDLYASLLPNTLVTGFRETLHRAMAPLVYIVNLMTSYTQTHYLTAADHVAEVSAYAGRHPDYVIMNTKKITDPQIIASYQSEGAVPLQDDLAPKPNCQIIRADLVAPVLAPKNDRDNLPRNYLRHDGIRLQRIIKKIIDENTKKT